MKDEVNLYPSKVRVTFCVRGGEILLESAPADECQQSSITRFSLQDVVGCNCLVPAAGDGASPLAIYMYRSKNKPGYRRAAHFIIAVNKCDSYAENLRLALAMRNRLLHEARGLPLLPGVSREPALRQVLVVINPFGGNGKALHIFQKEVLPIFEQANLHFKVFVTDYPGHAREMAQVLDIENWFGIVTVSGDGTIWEVVNGLMVRSDWSDAMTLPLAPLPGGSGNALVASLLSSLDESPVRPIRQASFLTVKARITTLDLMRLETASSSSPVFSFISLAWGFLADVDMESERFRYLGEQRFVLQSLLLLKEMRFYEGVLSYLPARPEELSHVPPEHRKYLRNFTYQSSYGSLPRPGSGSSPSNSSSSKSTSGAPQRWHERRAGHLVPFGEPVPKEWITIRDDFFTVCIANSSYITSSASVVPWSCYNDGFIYIMFARRGLSRLDVLRILSGMDSIPLVFHPHVELVACRAFRLVPISNPGIMCLDGERITYEPVQGEVLSGVARLMYGRR